MFNREKNPIKQLSLAEPGRQELCAKQECLIRITQAPWKTTSPLFEARADRNPALIPSEDRSTLKALPRKAKHSNSPDLSRLFCQTQLHSFGIAPPLPSGCFSRVMRERMVLA